MKPKAQNLNRRELLLGGSMMVCTAGCATSPSRFELLPGLAADHSRTRACDHDLCKLWRAEEGAPAASSPPGEPRMGRCSAGLPEGL